MRGVPASVLPYSSWPSVYSCTPAQAAPVLLYSCPGGSRTPVLLPRRQPSYSCTPASVSELPLPVHDPYVKRCE